jgi:hypothetical protein
MGEWSALAADHTETPEQLTSIRLSDMVVDYGLFTRIVTTNYRHFQPSSMISWRADHAKALELAVAAAKLAGIAATEQFESALATESFAQHYLQDSFAAGHMAFNRVASSNAAALTYHDQMSKQGRCVANERDEQWYTYGDNYLDRSPTGKDHVIAAAYISFYDVIEAFVTGEQHSENARLVWTKAPAFVDESITTPQMCGKTPNYYWKPLRSINRPAESVLTFEMASVVDSSIYRPAPRAITIGLSQDFIYTIPIGYRQIENRIFINVGTTVSQIGARSYIGQYGYVWHFATSLHGTLTHEVGFGQVYFNKPRDDQYSAYHNWSSHLLYAMNVEMGRVYLRFIIGPAWDPYGNSGVHASVGVGYVRSSTNKR